MTMPDLPDFVSFNDLAAEIARLRERNDDLVQRVADLESRAVGPLGTPVGRRPARRQGKD